MAVFLQGNHKCITYGVLHQNIVGIFLIPKDGPAGNRFINHGLVVEDTNSSPAVGYTVLIAGIELFSGLIILSADISLGIGNVVPIQLLQ